MKNNPVDFLGKTLNINDDVVFMRVGYRFFVKGKIVSLGKKKATIEVINSAGSAEKRIQFFEQIIKIEK